MEKPKREKSKRRLERKIRPRNIALFVLIVISIVFCAVLVFDFIRIEFLKGAINCALGGCFNGLGTEVAPP